MSVEPIVAVLEPGYAEYSTEQSAVAAFGGKLQVVKATDDAVSALSGKNVVAVLARERQVDSDIFDACPNLKLVLRYGIGVDNINLADASARRIAVANIPDYGAEHEVSDHAVALYLAVARRIVRRDIEVRNGVWNVGQSQPIPGHRDAILGIIGFGRIAKVAALKFRSLGFNRILAFDPALTPESASSADLTLASLEEICRQSDAISLHAPLTDQTYHMINEDLIGLMKPNAILVNVSRGGLVDEDALAKALTEGRIFGAGLDVFEHEPPSNSPLTVAPNTVLSDHTGWYSEASVRELQDHAATEVTRALKGEMPIHWVNKW